VIFYISFSASEKLEIPFDDGLKLVLAADGTEVDEDDALEAYKSKVFLLLRSSETWRRSFNYFIGGIHNIIMLFCSCEILESLLGFFHGVMTRNFPVTY
jgi:CIDE-N domain